MKMYWSTVILISTISVCQHIKILTRNSVLQYFVTPLATLIKNLKDNDIIKAVPIFLFHHKKAMLCYHNCNSIPMKSANCRNLLFWAWPKSIKKRRPDTVSLFIHCHWRCFTAEEFINSIFHRFTSPQWFSAA